LTGEQPFKKCVKVAFLVKWNIYLNPRLCMYSKYNYIGLLKSLFYSKKILGAPIILPRGVLEKNLY